MNTPPKSYTESTREWLERRFHAVPGELYRAHEPIYGIDRHADHTEPDHLWRAAKTTQIMRTLARLDVSTMLDIGAAEGYTAELARRLYGLTPTVTDVSQEAMLRARDLFALPGASVNASNLPFQDDAFDVVLCAECIEHLEHPYELILDAARVARKCLIISTVEAKATYWAARLSLYGLPIGEPHGHRSAWCREDFVRMLGPSVITMAQSASRPWTEGSTTFDTLKSVTVPPPPPHLGEGILMICLMDPGAWREQPKLDDDAVVRSVLDFGVALRPVSVPPEQAPVPESLTRTLRCPVCRRGDLTRGENALVCSSCGHPFSVHRGVPDLFVPQAAPLNELAALAKPKLRPAARDRLRWARKRAAQFDAEPRVRSYFMRMLIWRCTRFLEYLDGQPGWRGKARFLFGKLAPFRRVRT